MMKVASAVIFVAFVALLVLPVGECGLAKFLGEVLTGSFAHGSEQDHQKDRSHEIALL